MSRHLSWSRSITTRVTLVTLVIFVASIWSLAFYASRILHEKIQQLLGEQQFSSVSFMADSINEELAARLKAMMALASTIDAPLLEKPAALRHHMANLPLIPVLFNGGVFATGRDGTALADFPVVPGRVGTNYIDRESISVPLKEGKTVIGRPAMGKTLKAPIFSIVVPLLDRQGKVIGALCGTINLGLPNFLDKISIDRPDNTRVILVAPLYRLIVAATDKGRVMEVLPPPGVNALVDYFVEGHEGTRISVNPKGEEVLASAKRIPVAGWYVAAGLPTADAFGPIRDMQWNLLLATILLTLLAGFLTTWLLRRQFSPMRVAAKTLATMSDERTPQQPLAIDRHDEIGELIAGFNHQLATLKVREDALRMSEERNRKILETATDGFLLADMQGCVKEVNDAYCRMSGYSAQELLALHIADLDAIESADGAIAHIQKIKVQGEDRFESRQRRKDGSIFDVEVTARFLPVEGGRTVAFVRDISRRKQEDAERNQLEAQLRESQKMEALGTLAGGVAHDFNNALAAIFGNLALARQDVGPGHAAQLSLDEIERASRRAKDLVQQILSFSRRQKLQRKAVLLTPLVMETARLIRASLSATATLTVSCAPDTPVILADASQIKQILLNLCSNAMAAVQDRERGGLIEIDLRGYVHEEGQVHANLLPGQYACLTVRDNGSGMDDATRARLFEPFFTTKPVGKGTGLGLAVVHGIAHAHEAIIAVESAPGQGSAFHLYFPAIDAPVDTDTPPAAPAARARGAGKRVLYLDDEPALVFLMQRLLERQGFRVSSFTSPLEAVAAVNANPDGFDLVVTDYNMPGMSGLDVARALREIRADLPVLLTSGYITEELQQKAPDAGVRALIYKPNTADDLCEEIARYANAPGSGKDHP